MSEQGDISHPLLEMHLMIIYLHHSPSSSVTLQNTKSPPDPGLVESYSNCCAMLDFPPLKCSHIPFPTSQKHHYEIIAVTIVITVTVYVTPHLL